MTPQLPSTRPSSVREALLTAARTELVEHGSAAISLRAVARRAGVSHAAPKHHFADRAGLLTAVATEGFNALAAALRSELDAADARADLSELAVLGRAYIDFGLAHPALFDLMFRPSELHPDSPELLAAQREAIGILGAALPSSLPSPAALIPPGVPTWALLSWALVHGLVVLTRDGALGSASASPSADAAATLARTLPGVLAGLLDGAGGGAQRPR